MFTALIRDLEKMKKADMIKNYKELLENYEELQQEKDDLEDYCGELESACAEIETKESWIEENKYDELLKELKFNTELQDRLFPVFKDYILQLANFYCVDIPDEIYNAKLERGEIDQRIVNVIQDYIEDFTRFN